MRGFMNAARIGLLIAGCGCGAASPLAGEAQQALSPTPAAGPTQSAAEAPGPALTSARAPAADPRQTDVPTADPAALGRALLNAGPDARVRLDGLSRESL